LHREKKLLDTFRGAAARGGLGLMSGLKLDLISILILAIVAWLNYFELRRISRTIQQMGDGPIKVKMVTPPPEDDDAPSARGKARGAGR
jgi:hypothetical protein